MSGCSPWVCSVDYPTTPFAAWPMWGYDVLRTCCVAGAVLVVILTVAALYESGPSTSWGQQSRWLATLMFALSIAGTEFDHLGDLPSWRLFVNLLAVAGTVYGLWHFQRHENPGTRR